MMKPGISIIIPCLNEQDRLGPTLEALQTQTAPVGTFEVIVVDGGSSDGTVALTRQFGVRTISCERGLGRQRNAGSRSACADWLAFLDADCTPARNWTEVALEHVASGQADLVGAPITMPPGGTWVQRAWSAHMKVRRVQAETMGGNAGRLFTTANLLVSRRLFDQVGGFAEDLTSGEDYLFTTQALRQGARTFYDFRLTVTHRGEPATAGQFLRQQIWHSNPEAWRRIAAASGGSAGGNAPRYGIVHAVGMVAAAAGLCVSLATGWWLPVCIALGAHLALPCGLAARTVSKTRSLDVLPGLAVLYWLYGYARAARLLGLIQIAEKRERFRHAGARNC